MSEAESTYTNSPENILHHVPLGGAALAGDMLPNVIPTASEERPRPIEVIGGHDRGYIRTSPEGVRSLLTRSAEEAYVIPDREPRAVGVVERAADLITHFGVVIAGSHKRRRGIIEEYDATVHVDGGNGFDGLVIRAAGPLDASQLPNRVEQVETPVGSILPNPKVDITFTRHSEDKQVVTHRFVFAREGITRFERSIDDKDGYRTEVLERGAALDYLERHLPVVKYGVGRPALSQGNTRVNESTFRYCFDNIRRNRLGHNGGDIQRAALDKLDVFGYDTVLFVPEAYFNEHGRDGEFISVDVPEALIPADILEYPDPKSRVKKIVDQMGIDVRKTTVDDVLYLAEGLPGGWSRVAVLIKEGYDKAPGPQLKSVPTSVYDKSLMYLLQHPDVVAETITAYREMTSIVGEPVTADNIQIAFEAGLLDRDPAKAREIFEAFVRPLGIGARKAPVAQAALDKVFAVLVGLGDKLKEAYSEEEITHYTQRNALLIASTAA
ncbi:MAG TPA: hypothetical protein VJ836_06740 [Candidatus Saccharimonadales bacterium]|nr:hypothetical protein [Candidatus Saccharimonadales bacterium]